tara:strand:- start:8950 stop:9399 length:450 start_codon:yes stop_codon:yes gene_type:complete
MKKLILIFITIMFVNNSAFSAGSKEEAAALLDRAIALLDLDKNRALEQFVSGDGGLIIGDLYVFCFALDGTISAHPALLGANIHESPNKDINGTPLGEAFFSIAEAGIIKEVVYRLRKYDSDSEKEFTKTALMTKVSDQICGVGYYSDQ